MDYNNFNNDKVPNYNPQYAAPAAPALPMNWHKFVIYFVLFANAVLNVINAIQYFTGSIYGGEYEKRMVYTVFSGLQTIDVLMGIMCLAVAVYALLTRFALAGYQAKAPKMMSSMYLINAGIAILYLLLASASTGIGLGDLMNASLATSLVVSVIMFFANKTYYAKRAALFTK
ncbi:MAG: hypothetical protein E7324_00095 [Clostridiales bacterium]|nr:hypothetical protein [Clostridiales bacterium]